MDVAEVTVGAWTVQVFPRMEETDEAGIRILRRREGGADVVTELSPNGVQMNFAGRGETIGMSVRVPLKEVAILAALAGAIQEAGMTMQKPAVEASAKHLQDMRALVAHLLKMELR